MVNKHQRSYCTAGVTLFLNKHVGLLPQHAIGNLLIYHGSLIVSSSLNITFCHAIHSTLEANDDQSVIDTVYNILDPLTDHEQESCYDFGFIRHIGFLFTLWVW